VSFQITILKVLAGHPGGCARVADLSRDVRILMSCGPEWASRIKRLAARAPQLDIFGRAFVLRDDSGWQITDAGRQFLDWLEASPTAQDQEQQYEVNVAVAPTTLTLVQPALRLVIDNTRPSQADCEPDRTRQIA
jgi:hypothetical protein